MEQQTYYTNTSNSSHTIIALPWVRQYGEIFSSLVLYFPNTATLELNILHIASHSYINNTIDTELLAMVISRCINVHSENPNKTNVSILNLHLIIHCKYSKFGHTICISIMLVHCKYYHSLLLKKITRFSVTYKVSKENS